MTIINRCDLPIINGHALIVNAYIQYTCVISSQFSSLHYQPCLFYSLWSLQYVVIYKAIWILCLGKILSCKEEPGNIHDLYATAVSQLYHAFYMTCPFFKEYKFSQIFNFARICSNLEIGGIKSPQNIPPIQYTVMSISLFYSMIICDN